MTRRVGYAGARAVSTKAGSSLLGLAQRKFENTNSSRVAGNYICEQERHLLFPPPLPARLEPFHQTSQKPFVPVFGRRAKTG